MQARGQPHAPAILPSEKPIQAYRSAWFLADRGVSGAGGRAYWVWGSGEGWVCICLELKCDKVNCIYGGGED